MIKIREARYCNMKLLLICLVIYGHLIEPQVGQNTMISMQYKTIYLFHMPAFAFLSGLFISNRNSCILQLKKTLSLYIVLQIVCSLCREGNADLITPYWILWYLLSLSWWLGAAWLWLKFSKGKGGSVILAAAVLAGCLAGYADVIDRRLSLSRTLVFFPYFFLGLLSHSKTDWKKYRTAGILALCLSILLFSVFSDRITVSFLYQAAPYGMIQNGALLRLVCYITGVSVILFLITWIPDRRFPFTKAGSNTMPAYLIHTLFVIFLRELYLPWYIYIVLTIIFLWILCRITQLTGTIYGITLWSRRDEQCPLSKRYTKKMRENYMVFSSRSQGIRSWRKS